MKFAIYYDGLCHACSWEMKKFHAKQEAREQIDFIDYTAPEFDAPAEGLNREALDRYLHVKMPTGEIRVGVDALIEIWRRVPGWSWAARLASFPLLKPIFRLGYFCFAHVRRRLPKRKQSCPLPAAVRK